MDFGHYRFWLLNSLRFNKILLSSYDKNNQDSIGMQNKRNYFLFNETTTSL